MTVIAVVRVPATATDGGLIGTCVNVPITYLGYAAGKLKLDYQIYPTANPGTATSTGVINDGIPHVIILNMNTAAGKTNIYLDGKSVLNQAISSYWGGQRFWFLGAAPTSGALGGTSSSPFVGDVAECLFIRSGLSGSDISEYTKYFKYKYGLPF